MISITMDNFISATLSCVDNVIGAFVHITYNNLVQGNLETITTCLVIYVMLAAYRFLTHQLPMMAILQRLILLSCVYGLFIEWPLYNLFFYNIFQNEPGILSQVIINSSGHFAPGESTNQALDAIFKSGMQTASGLLAQGGWHNFLYTLFGGIVWLITFALCLGALALFIYAKMATAVFLGIGPLFILCMLWDATRHLFASWLQNLINFALIPIVTTAILSFMLSIINLTLLPLKEPANEIQYFAIVPCLGLMAVTALLLLQVKTMCSSLSGGITLESLSRISSLATSGIQNSGLGFLGKQTAHLAKKGYNLAKQGYQAKQEASKKQATILAKRKVEEQANKK